MKHHKKIRMERDAKSVVVVVDEKGKKLALEDLKDTRLSKSNCGVELKHSVDGFNTSSSLSMECLQTRSASEQPYYGKLSRVTRLKNFQLPDMLLEAFKYFLIKGCKYDDEDDGRRDVQIGSPRSSSTSLTLCVCNRSSSSSSFNLL